MGMLEFITQMLSNPMLLVSSLLTMGVILVNGWTDAPNAIATCVATRAISVKKAIVMAAIFNFLGVLVMTSINASVAFTIYNMVDFGNNSRLALIALCAAMAANHARIPLAKLAVEETGMGVVEDKVIKNHFACECHSYIFPKPTHHDHPLLHQ